MNVNHENLRMLPLFAVCGLRSETTGRAFSSRARSTCFGSTTSTHYHLTRVTTMRLSTKATPVSSTLVCDRAYCQHCARHPADIEFDVAVNPNTDGVAMIDALLHTVDAAVYV